MMWLRNEYLNANSSPNRQPLKNITDHNGPTGSVETSYSWDYGNAHFIMLNVYWNGGIVANSDSDGNLSRGDYSGDITTQLYTWLQADLAATDKPFIFIFMHEPAFPYNHHYGDSLDRYPTNRNAFWSLLESEKVTAVFNGHTHYYSKHQGDVRGHTYDYPAINSWRTQDPNKAGLYGKVWQIDVGNAGYDPGGRTAGPNSTDNLPSNLQWNGLTFIDVVVNNDDAIIKVYRDPCSLSDPNIGQRFTLADTITVNGDFLAYNDCVVDSCLVGYGIDPCGNSVHYGDPNRVTDYGIGSISTDHQDPNASYVSSGLLKDYATGANTTVRATLTQDGNVIWQPWVGISGTTHWTGGYDPTSGTDAYNTFHGIADMTGVIYYGNAPGWWVDVNFTGLDSNKSYTFATSASRAKDRTDGEPNGYTTRRTLFTISGVDSATNASTPGVEEVNNYSVRFCTGDNHFEGYVARWTGIRPGTDGSFKVRAQTADPNVNSAYAFSVFMLREEPMAPDNEPPTPNPMTWASLPTATGSYSITMTATTATEPNYPPVMYYFECTNHGEASSTWQQSPIYVATGLMPSTQYTFRVKARDGAPSLNETDWSSEQSATTPANTYLTKFIQMAGWLATQQITSGADIGGIKEGEDNGVVQTDNTAEAVWIWSRYAELTGDYTTYLTNLNNAWTYCHNNPSWHENQGDTPPSYYMIYNSGWGMLAEMKYRQVYGGRPEYVDHTWYGEQCAQYFVDYTPGTTTSDYLCLGIGSGALYQYGVDVNNATYKSRAVTLGGNVRTWLNATTSRFRSESWAVSGGVAVWGVLNSYYKDPANSAGAATWAADANRYMPLNAADGANPDYEYGHDGWYAWGHYACSEYLGSGSFTKYKDIIDLLLASDGDNDGGIRQGPTFGNTSDYAWSTNCMQAASNMGLIAPVYPYTISGTITSGGSPLAGVKMNGLPGSPVTNGSGVYSSLVVSGWDGTVTPTKTGYGVTPATRTYSNVTSNQTGQNYTAAAATPDTITFDANTSASSGTAGTTLSWSHTVGSGNNRMLIVESATEDTDWSDATIKSVTYGSTNNLMAVKGSSKRQGSIDTDLWYLPNPPVGTNTITINYFGSVTSRAGGAISLRNVKQQPAEDANTHSSSSANTITTNITTRTNGDWVADVVGHATSGSFTTSTSTERWDRNSGNHTGAGATKAVATAGSTPLTWTFSSSAAAISHSLASFAPSETAPPARTLTASSTAGGDVTAPGEGAFSYANGTPVTLTATADLNYHFVNWTGDTSTIANVDSPVTTITMNGNYTIQANFAIDQKSLTTSVIGSGTVTTPGIGTYWYDINTDANIVASASANHHFVNWTGTAVTAGKVADVNAASTTVTMDANYTVQANFAIDTHTVTFIEGANGTITGTLVQVVNHGSDCTSVQAMPNANHHFTGWTGSYVGMTNPLTITNITADMTITANFAIDTFTLNYAASAGGSLTGDADQVVDYNTSGTAVTAVADIGHHFVKWSDDSVANPRTDAGVTASINVTATFEIDTFILNYAAGAGGSLTGETSQVVDYNTSGTAVTAVADIGHHFVKWSDDSVANPRTDVGVTASINVTATFEIDQMTISGYITEPDANIPVEGVSIDANNDGGSDTTDANGYYELTVDYGWSGTVIPSKTGYTFEPNGTEYSNVTANQNDNYIATLKTFIISGYAIDSTLAPLAGVLVAPDNNGGSYTSKYYGGGSDTTDVNGYYEVLVDYNWSGNVVLSKYAYAFQPSSLTYANVTEDIAEQNYVGTLQTYKITGNIKNACEVPIEGVLVEANNGGGSDTTDTNGDYEVWVSYNWSGTVTPSKAHYTFDPVNRAYTDVLDDKTGQDYLANNIYDLDCDGSIGYGDIAVIGENWLQTGPNIPGDFDKNNIVNFLDFADFALVW
jgi:hypothetical protein